jgi:hypothetical protein
MAVRKTRRKAEPKKRAKAGQPTKYTSKMPQALIDYFLTCAETRPGVGVPVLKETFTIMPTLTGFAKKVGVTTRTLANWKDKHEAFEEAYQYSMAIAADMIQQFSINNVWSPSMSVFLLKSNHGLQDKTVIEHGGPITIILDDLQKGSV